MVHETARGHEKSDDKLNISRPATLRSRLVKEWERLSPLCMRDPRNREEWLVRHRESRIASILSQRYNYKPWVR